MTTEEEFLHFQGKVTAVLPNRICKVIIEEFNNKEVTTYIAGKLSQKKVRLNIGDEVTVEFSSKDPNTGRIIARKERINPAGSPPPNRNRRLRRQH